MLKFNADPAGCWSQLPAGNVSDYAAACLSQDAINKGQSLDTNLWHFLFLPDQRITSYYQYRPSRSCDLAIYALIFRRNSVGIPVGFSYTNRVFLAIRISRTGLHLASVSTPEGLLYDMPFVIARHPNAVWENRRSHILTRRPNNDKYLSPNSTVIDTTLMANQTVEQMRKEMPYGG